MKHILTCVALAVSASTCLAQPSKPSYNYFEGLNLSAGVSQNKTKKTETATTTSSSTSAPVAKVNYTFALAYPAKLGVSATMDMNESLKVHGIQRYVFTNISMHIQTSLCVDSPSQHSSLSAPKIQNVMTYLPSQTA
jgi:hypothetical protein